MTIGIKCPRCGTTVKAPDSKAGKRGRCPICGGAVKVPKREDLKGKEPPAPVVEAAPAVAHAGHQVIWVAAAVVMLLIALSVIIALSHGRGTTVGVTTRVRVLSPEAQEKLRKDLLQFDVVEREAQAYQHDRVQEQRLRAREVLAKRNRYEPVTAFEDELRRQALEDQAKAAVPQGENGIPKNEWRLSAPLTPSEKPELERLSGELQRKASRLKENLAAVGIVVTLSDDALGRALLNADDATVKVAARKEEIRKTYLESAN